MSNSDNFYDRDDERAEAAEKFPAQVDAFLLDKYDDHIATTIDPVCLSHGVPWSQNPPHWAGKCLVCQLCFKVLGSLEECNPLSGGMPEDVCVVCAREEQETHERMDRS